MLILASVCVGCSPPSATVCKTPVERCPENLAAIYEGLQEYRARFGKLPERGGVPFIAALVSSGVWENVPANAIKLTCPGVKLWTLDIVELPPETWWTDLDRVSGASSAYAVRDVEVYPVDPTDEPVPLVADDNDGGQNHRSSTFVLYSDGSVRAFELDDLKDAGILPADAEQLVVGPASPIPELRALRLD